MDARSRGAVSTAQPSAEQPRPLRAHHADAQAPRARGRGSATGPKHRDLSLRRRAVARVAAVLFGGVLILGLGSTAWGATMIAADAPTTVTLAPGATGAVPVTIKNTGAVGTITAGSGSPGDGMVFVAPPHTTFPAQSTVTVQYSSNGTTFGANNYRLVGCVVSNGGTTLSCQPSSANGGASLWPAGGYFRFLPQVTVDANAPANTQLAGSSTLRFTTIGGSAGTHYVTTVGTLHVATPPSAGTPMVTPAGAAATGGLALVGSVAVWLGLSWRRRA